MSFAQALVGMVEGLLEKTKHRKRRQHRQYDRRAHLGPDPDEWNTHDIITYYELLHKACFGFTPRIRIDRAASQAKYFRDSFKSGADVKVAMQIYFSMQDGAPEMFGLMTTGWMINRIKEHWDYPFSAKVFDKRVFAS